MIITRDVVQQAQEAFDEYIAAMNESDYMDIEIPMNAAEWVPALIRLVGELKQEEGRLREAVKSAISHFDYDEHQEGMAALQYALQEDSE